LIIASHRPDPAVVKKSADSTADLIHVLSVVTALRRVAVNTWIHIDNLKPGERWKNAIEAALADADTMIFCL